MQYTITFIHHKERTILAQEKKDFENYGDACLYAVRECICRGKEYVYSVRPKNGTN